MAEAKQKFNYSLLRRVLQLSFPYKKLFYWTIFLAIIQAPIGILRPHLINVMVDEKYTVRIGQTGDVVYACAGGVSLAEIYFYIGYQSIRAIHCERFKDTGI